MPAKRKVFADRVGSLEFEDRERYYVIDQVEQGTEIVEAIGRSEWILLFGHRQCGKSTQMKQLIGSKRLRAL